MKISPFLLTVSLVGNLALVALVLKTPGDVASSPESTVANPAKAKASGTAATGSGGAIDTSDVDPKLWEGLAAGDFAGLTAKLQAAGFPPAVVRAIVSAQVGESFAARRKALTASQGNRPFWVNDQPNDPKIQAALRELSKEQTKLMKELLGASANDYDDPSYAAMMRRQFGDLPKDKIEMINRVRQDYSELTNDIYTAAGMGGGGPITMTNEERAKIALLQKEQREDIKQLLSPQEFEDYELRTNNTANSMRYNLSAFEPSEQEFRTIFALQRAFDEKFNTQSLVGAQGTPAAQELMRQRTEAQKQLTAEIKAQLSPERAAEYERAIDYNYQQISRVVQRLDLPKETAAQVWAVQKEIEQRSVALRSLPPADRNDQLAALAAEANARLISSLGQRGLDVYKQYGGYWLQNLQPPAARPGTVTAPAGTTTIIRP